MKIKGTRRRPLKYIGLLTGGGCGCSSNLFKGGSRRKGQNGGRSRYRMNSRSRSRNGGRSRSRNLRRGVGGGLVTGLGPFYRTLAGLPQSVSPLALNQSMLQTTM